jgi:hypothetical protein
LAQIVPTPQTQVLSLIETELLVGRPQILIKEEEQEILDKALKIIISARYADIQIIKPQTAGISEMMEATLSR